MNDLLAQYRRRDKAVRIAGILALLLLIALLVIPDLRPDNVGTPLSEVALFEPARSQAADEFSAVERDYDFSLE